MKKIPLLIKTFLIFFIFNSVPLAAIAQNAYPAANFLLDYAKTLYQRGDFVNARHELKTLLVIDPNNAPARQYLKKMGLLALPEDTVYSQNLKLRKQNVQLKASLNKFKEEVIDKNMRIADLKQEAGGREEKIKALDNLVGVKDEAVANLHQELRLQRKKTELRLFVRESQLEAVLSNLERLNAQIDEYREKAHSLEGELESLRQSSQIELDLKERQLEQKHDKIINLSREFDVLWQRLIRAERDNTAQEMRLAQLLGESDSLRASLQEKEIEAAALKEQLTGLKNENWNKDREIKQLQALRELEAADFKERGLEIKDLLQTQEMEIAALNTELKLQQEAADKQLMEKELELAARYTDIEELNLRLSQSNLQLEQAEKEKLDKDLWIEQLNNKVKQLEEASSDQLSKYLQKLNSLEDSLKHKEEESADSSAKSSEIERLNIKINECQKKAVILENALKVKDSELAELNKKSDSRSLKR
ncbi:MAG: hypothetical protein QME65_05940 [Candidatus Omnitrophota bacterium]|nr:hypothetical protein [Candidatus Omnitrophota bacterium]